MNQWIRNECFIELDKFKFYYGKLPSEKFRYVSEILMYLIILPLEN